ncbi:PD-(D/E)XK nuclease family protein [Vacuolonema iberomarrocanum]|uniref:PDDEXK-like family protein n=1 Tax=Vacuolonema iberomarrocanum TaxID=3454632 RepID=UPI003F6E149D
MNEKEQQELLKKLIIDNEDLRNLEAKLSEFNIFEAVGIVRQEIKHSNFLAFLINPSGAHRLGDTFLKKMLIFALGDVESASFSPIEIDIADLTDSDVRREWRNIDILIYSESNDFVCVIENKIDSLEHSDQLKRYEETIYKEFPSSKMLFVYLTKSGDASSKAQWISLSYGDIAILLEDVYKLHRTTVGDEISMLMKHYIALIRRHIVGDSEISRLCQKIYKQHRQALDLIYENRPDFQSEIADYLGELIMQSANTGIQQDDSNKRWIRFAPTEWDDLSFQLTCERWTSSKRILMFEFVNDSRFLNLDLVIGPGERTYKEAIFGVIKSLRFPGTVKKSHLKEDGWSHIYKRGVVGTQDFEDGDFESVKEKIDSFWKRYLNGDIAEIRKAISEHFSPDTVI